MDYPSDGLGRQTALIRILSAFRTVATPDEEAHILPAHLHLRYRAQNTIDSLRTTVRSSYLGYTAASLEMEE
ncbi:uncharacterized protein N7525_000305 [Penicillium rubens]|uniref:uncharacterized protein n=1 Tax=Penicillium rubens TaxID=1108849 RepID=UPI002A59E137|nr:uncharacterized protein N7525_000305 [Penicillium rubens]KAJ5842564.1 hypothetical protein N7525_000305 [Penicillium rubens]